MRDLYRYFWSTIADVNRAIRTRGAQEAWTLLIHDDELSFRIPIVAESLELGSIHLARPCSEFASRTLKDELSFWVGIWKQGIGMLWTLETNTRVLTILIWSNRCSRQSCSDEDTILFLHASTFDWIHFEIKTTRLSSVMAWYDPPGGRQQSHLAYVWYFAVVPRQSHRAQS